ncbi:glycoside hydrolase superfamily [Mycena sanguinolenta]|nr:glycoside hydrolase superfamily [Mycena sanguinolenta]
MTEIQLPRGRKSMRSARLKLKKRRASFMVEAVNICNFDSRACKRLAQSGVPTFLPDLEYMMQRISVGLTAVLALYIITHRDRPGASIRPMIYVSPKYLDVKVGGQGWDGPTTCVAGAVCIYENPYYSNCFLSAGSSPEGSNTVATTLGGKFYFGTRVPNKSLYTHVEGILFSGVYSYESFLELNDPAYAAKLNNVSLFGQLTPASLSWVWDILFSFINGDAMVALAKKNGQLVRSPPCISLTQLPNWVNTLETSSGTLFDILINHCLALVKHYAGEIPLQLSNSEGTAPVGASVANDVDPSYIDDILTSARAADPAAKLYVAATGMNIYRYLLVRHLYIGSVTETNEHSRLAIQWHGRPGAMVAGTRHPYRRHRLPKPLCVPSKEALMANYQNFTLLGIEVAITVLDIRGGPVADVTGQQKADYETVISACKAVPGCVGVTLADITDKKVEEH